MTKWPVSAAAETCLDGLVVTHLTDEDDVRVLAHGRAHGRHEVLGVDAHLALVHHRHLVEVQHLDRVLDRDDVDLLVGVDVVDHPGERGGLARAGRSGDQDQPTRLHGERGEDGRQPEVGQGDRTDADPTEDQAGRSAAAEGVDAEAPEPGHGVREVGLVGALELLDEVLPEHLGDHLGGVRRGQVTRLELAQLAVDAHAGR
jgi:hypothetical protein